MTTTTLRGPTGVIAVQGNDGQTYTAATGVFSMPANVAADLFGAGFYLSSLSIGATGGTGSTGPTGATGATGST